ncbi:MAG TPA: hypothetical protein VHY58_17930 [Streptosporangiaceae bacterium]|nr:hypothetical protein [Streptosporangiaceae bacterium]
MASEPAIDPEVISPDEFFRADIRVGLVVRAEEFPEARNPASEVLVLGVPVEGRTNVALIQPDREVPPGTSIF